MSEFHPIEDEKEALGLLRDSVTTLSSTMVWTKNQEQVIDTHLSFVSEVEKAIYVWVPPTLKPSDFQAQLKQLGSVDCYFSISTPRANLFFKAPFVQVDEGGLKFDFPTKFFKVQRRKDFRFVIPDGHVLRVEFDDPLQAGQKARPKVIDVSAGGLAFLVPESEESLYPVGMIIPNLTFSIKSKKISVDGEVRHKRATADKIRSPGIKVGVIFKDLGAGDHQHISGYVLEESRKYFSRFI